MDSQPVRFIEGAGSMHEPEGRGRLAALLARELGTDCGLIAPEMCAMPTAGYPPADQQASAYDGGGVR
jgi:hypothetical protein